MSTAETTDTADATDTADTRFTLRDWERLPEGFPCELIEGALVKEPAPTYHHQRVIVRLLAALLPLVGPERVAPAPVDLVLDEHSVLQPDVLVWDAAQARGTEQVSIPALAIEVLSRATAARDRGAKTRLYLAAGVAEVWLVDPDTGTIEVRTRAASVVHGPVDEAVSAAVPGFAARGADLVR